MIIKDGYSYAKGRLKEAHLIKGVEPRLQNDYGKSLDCTIVSIATIINYLFNNEYNFGVVYNNVLENAPALSYVGNLYGTIPLFKNRIINNTLKAYGLTECKSKSHYLKGMGYGFELVKKLVEEETPFVLSLSNANDGAYKNHSVVGIGYKTYERDGKLVRLIVIYDNWSKEYRYVDYDTINMFSMISYIE